MEKTNKTNKLQTTNSSSMHACPLPKKPNEALYGKPVGSRPIVVAHGTKEKITLPLPPKRLMQTPSITRHVKMSGVILDRQRSGIPYLRSLAELCPPKLNVLDAMKQKKQMDDKSKAANAIAKEDPPYVKAEKYEFWMNYLHAVNHLLTSVLNLELADLAANYTLNPSALQELRKPYSLQSLTKKVGKALLGAPKIIIPLTGDIPEYVGMQPQFPPEDEYGRTGPFLFHDRHQGYPRVSSKNLPNGNESMMNFIFGQETLPRPWQTCVLQEKKSIVQMQMDKGHREVDAIHVLKSVRNAYLKLDRAMKCEYEKSVEVMEDSLADQFSYKTNALKLDSFPSLALQRMRKKAQAKLIAKKLQEIDDGAKPPLWYLSLYQEALSLSIADRPDVEQALKYVQSFSDPECFLIPWVHERLCYIVLSLPILELATKHWQKAILFVLKSILGVKAAETILQQWLHFRGLWHLR